MGTGSGAHPPNGTPPSGSTTTPSGS
jgi:hypothetical protein